MGSHQVHLPWPYDSITGIYYSIWVPGWDGLWMKKWKNWIQKKYMGRSSWVQHIVVITQSLQLNALHIFLVPYSIHIKFQKKKKWKIPNDITCKGWHWEPIWDVRCHFWPNYRLLILASWQLSHSLIGYDFQRISIECVLMLLCFFILPFSLRHLNRKP